MHSSKGTCVSVIRFFFTTNWFISVNFHYHLFSSGPVARTCWKLNYSHLRCFIGVTLGSLWKSLSMLSKFLSLLVSLGFHSVISKDLVIKLRFGKCGLLVIIYVIVTKTFLQLFSSLGVVPHLVFKVMYLSLFPWKMVWILSTVALIS